MIVIYNKDSFKEVACDKPPVHIGKCIDDVRARIELANRELPVNAKFEVYEGEAFPPPGKFFEIGVGLRDKTEKEKVVAGEILLADIKTKIKTTINKLCSEKILSGFESNALGEIHVYNSDSEDQQNLVGAVASGDSTFYKCTRKADGKRDFFLHTNAQIKKVLIDGKKRKEELLQHCYLLNESLKSLTSYDEIIDFDILQGW